MINKIIYSKEEIIVKLHEIFAKRDEIILGYLFGSYAEDRVHKFSDIDVAVYVKDLSKEKEFDYKVGLLDVVSRAFHTDNIDIVILNNTSHTLRHRILHYGIKVKCSNEAFRCSYMVNSFHQYVDFKHFLNIQYSYMYQRLAKYAQR